MNLNRRLESLGVRVCSLTTGAPEDFGESSCCLLTVGGDTAEIRGMHPSTKPTPPGGMTAPEQNVPVTAHYSRAVCGVLEDITSAA